PVLREILPPIPKQLAYDFLGRTLLLRDIDADIVADYLPDALPAQPPAGVPTVQPAAGVGVVSPLPMPSVRGATLFAIIGDSGSGDRAQQAVAQAMPNYSHARRVPCVVVVGDN